MMSDSAHRIRFGPYEADLRTEEIWKEGVRLKLSRQPFEILKALLARPGVLVTREELQKQLWSDDEFVDSSHGLNAAINKLRDALCDSADNPRYIETLPRRGYRFIGSVEGLGAIQATSQETPVQAQAVLPEPPPSHSESVLGPNQLPASIVAARPARPLIFFAVSAALILGIFFGVALTGIAPRARTVLLQVSPHTLVQNPSAKEAAEWAAQVAGELEQHGPEKAEAEMKARLHRAAPRASLDPVAQTASVRTIIGGDGGNAGPQFSPDGTRIAFMSSRTGTWQIWLSNADGSDPVQLSDTESAGTPRWSPDGRSIAFDAPLDGTTRIFVAPVDSRQRARPVVEGLVPSFSRDGKCVYFASDRTGDWQVWKVPVTGGPEIQVTTQGGFAALESADGYVYYSKSRYPNPEIWRKPVSGGEEAFVSHSLRPRTWSSWTVTKGGILFVEDMANGKTELSLYGPRTREIRELVSLPSAPFWMGASADGRKVLVSDSEERQITMLERLQ